MALEVGFDVDEQLEKLSKIPRSARFGAIAAVLVAVAAGYYFMSYQDSRAQVSRLEAEAQELQRKLNKVRVVASNLGEFEQEVADLERDLEVALKQLPNRKQFEDLLRDISTAGKKVGIDLKGINREKELDHEFYAEVPFKINFDGNYHDIAKFFERLSKLSRIVNIGSLEMKASRDAGSSVLSVDGTATTFRFLADENEPAGEAAPSTPPKSGERA